MVQFTPLSASMIVHSEFPPNLEIRLEFFARLRRTSQSNPLGKSNPYPLRIRKFGQDPVSQFLTRADFVSKTINSTDCKLTAEAVTVTLS